MLKKISMVFAALVLVACTSMPVSTNGQLVLAYNTVSAYVDVTKNALVRGRISVADAEKASAKAKNLSVNIDQAASALQACKQQLPCDTYTDILKAIQPSLLELELELRKAQGEVK